ncbi:MAG: toxin-antitoxin system YwqK family antitoxin [Bacteroidales bacterium]|jgi:antitoxin component YwqK of YwqJK toxin-antitoxin module|nr:toxin-antitoxin system YwqK family antitoxin [Bacteroidales bacterium]
MKITGLLTGRYPIIKRYVFHLAGIMVPLVLILNMCSLSVREDKSYYPNGKIKFRLPKNESGQLHGLARFWYENGNLELTGEYENGVLNGKLSRYRENGIIESEDIYVDGKLNGMCRTFHYNGNVLSEMPYVNDTLHGMSRQFDDVGQIMIEGNYERGYFEGKWIYHDRLGNINGEAEFKQGTGLKKSYDPEGNLTGTVEYMDNLMHGREIWYNKEGKQITTRYYDQGSRVSYEVASPLQP